MTHQTLTRMGGAASAARVAQTPAVAELPPGALPEGHILLFLLHTAALHHLHDPRRLNEVFGETVVAAGSLMQMCFHMPVFYPHCMLDSVLSYS